MRHLEITSIIPCPNRCSYCPQDKLEKAYKGEKKLTLDKFKKALNNVPVYVKIHFSGFSEIFIHPDGHEFVRYAHDRGHKIQVYTTGVGFKEEKIHGLKYKLFINRKDSLEKPISRAGNLFPVQSKQGKLICGKSIDFNQNVMLPNGDVYLCCMDYSLKHKLGNIFETNFNDLTRKSQYKLCRTCEFSIICE